MAQRVVVFIDAQNFYRSARRTFFSDEEDPTQLGNFRPHLLAERICARDEGRQLDSVRIYTGRPDRNYQPGAHAASVRRADAWARGGALVSARTLRYPADWPREQAQEKGVDVALAVDVVSMSLRGAMDVAVVASGDTDLRPALDEVLIRTSVKIEVAAWRSDRHRQRLSLPGRNVWCHWLSQADFEAVRDDTDYNVPTS